MLKARLAALAFTLVTSACVGGGGFSIGGAGGARGGAGPGPSGGPPVTGGQPGDGGGELAPAGTPEKLSDFAFEVKDATGTYYTAWIIDKLTTFQVSPACYAKMTDRKQSAVHSATFYTRDIEAYAKSITGDEWSDIESQNNNDRERNKQLVEPMIDSFAKSFHLTISVDGDDCDASHGSLWMRYWTTLGTILRDYPPASRQAFITLDVRGDVRDLTVTVDETGTKFHITAPRDIEKAGWNDKLEKPFRKLVAR